MNKQEFILRIYNRKYVDKLINKVKLLGIGDRTSAYDLLLERLVSSIAIFVLFYVFFMLNYFFFVV